MKLVTVTLTPRQRTRLLAILSTARADYEAEAEHCFDDEEGRRIEATLTVLDGLVRAIEPKPPLTPDCPPDSPDCALCVGCGRCQFHGEPCYGEARPE